MSFSHTLSNLHKEFLIPCPLCVQFNPRLSRTHNSVGSHTLPTNVGTHPT